MSMDNQGYYLNMVPFNQETQQKLEKDAFEKFQKIGQNKKGAGIIATYENDYIDTIINGNTNLLVTMLIELIFKTLEIENPQKRAASLKEISDIFLLESRNLESQKQNN